MYEQLCVTLKYCIIQTAGKRQAELLPTSCSYDYVWVCVRMMDSQMKNHLLLISTCFSCLRRETYTSGCHNRSPLWNQPLLFRACLGIQEHSHYVISLHKISFILFFVHDCYFATSFPPTWNCLLSSFFFFLFLCLVIVFSILPCHVCSSVAYSCHVFVDMLV